MTYAERMQLTLRRTGSIDVDKQGRERARRDRDNAKRRAMRAAARKAKGNMPSVEVSSSQRVIVVGEDSLSRESSEIEPNSELVLKEGGKGERVRRWEGSKQTESRQSSHLNFLPGSLASGSSQDIPVCVAHPGLTGIARLRGSAQRFHRRDHRTNHPDPRRDRVAVGAIASAVPHPFAAPRAFAKGSFIASPINVAHTNRH